MPTNCLGCGTPLGTQTGLYYTCRCDAMDGEQVVSIDDDIKERLERYFVIASIRCSNCGDIHGQVESDGEVFTADDFGIETVEEWELEMDKEEAWIEDNVRAVRAALLDLEADWPHTVQAVIDTLLR